MGVIQPVCTSGYAVTSEEVRKVLEIAGGGGSQVRGGDQNWRLRGFGKQVSSISGWT